MSPSAISFPQKQHGPHVTSTMPNCSGYTEASEFINPSLPWLYNAHLMKTARLVVFCLLSTLLVRAQEAPIVIHAVTLLDGRGHVQHDVDIVVQNGKIARIGKAD